MNNVFIGYPPDNIKQWIIDNYKYAYTVVEYTAECGLPTAFLKIDGALSGNIPFSQHIENVVIGNTVTSIVDYAFNECIHLTSVTIPSSVIDIGLGAFDYCSSLVNVVVNEGVKNIDAAAFTDCSSLSTLTLPSSIEKIGSEAFHDCSSLTSLTFLGKTMEEVQNIEDSYGNKCYPWGISDTGIIHAEHNGNVTKFTLQDGMIETYDISGELDKQWMVDNGFYDNDEERWLKTIYKASIGDTVFGIVDNAFSGCSSLSTLTMPSSIVNIAYQAFYNCTGLTSIDIPSSVNFIGDGAFAGCSCLTGLVFPDSIEGIGMDAFADCLSLSTLTLPSSVYSIGQDAFFGCSSLTSLAFLGKTMEEVQDIEDDFGNPSYPWGIDPSFISAEY